MSTLYDGTESPGVYENAYIMESPITPPIIFGFWILGEKGSVSAALETVPFYMGEQDSSLPGTDGAMVVTVDSIAADVMRLRTELFALKGGVLGSQAVIVSTTDIAKDQWTPCVFRLIVAGGTRNYRVSSTIGSAAQQLSGTTGTLDNVPLANSQSIAIANAADNNWAFPFAGGFGEVWTKGSFIPGTDLLFELCNGVPPNIVVASPWAYWPMRESRTADLSGNGRNLSENESPELIDHVADFGSGTHMLYRAGTVAKRYIPLP